MFSGAVLRQALEAGGRTRVDQLRKCCVFKTPLALLVDSGCVETDYWQASTAVAISRGSQLVISGLRTAHSVEGWPQVLEVVGARSLVLQLLVSQMTGRIWCRLSELAADKACDGGETGAMLLCGSSKTTAPRHKDQAQEDIELLLDKR